MNTTAHEVVSTMSTSDTAASAKTSARVPLGLVRATLGIIAKDFLLEWRGRARINATIFFAVLTLLLFSFAVGPHHAILEQNAPGYLWLAIMLASIMSLGESQRVEAENAALEGLRLLAVDARAIYLGKAIVNMIFLMALALVLVPVSIALYGTTIRAGFGSLLSTLLLGTAAISAPGTLYAAIAVQARARDVLLPLLLFPILIPGLLASVKATSLVLTGDPMGELVSWTILLGAFNVVYWILCGLLFGRVIEE